MIRLTVQAVICVTLLVSLLTANSVHAFAVTKDTRVRGRNYDNYSFSQYVEEFGKQYKSDIERTVRQSAFEKNMARIRTHNGQAGISYVMGVNDMTDWSDEEFSRINRAKPLMRSRVSKRGLVKEHVASADVKSPPYRVDYRTAVPPVLTSIKNQGNCGSCWAHSAVEAIESHWAIATGNLYVLSQQQLTSCTPNPRHCGGAGGCEGSVESLAFEYVAEAGGLAEEWGYGYTSYYGDSGVCKTVGAPKVAKVKGYVDIPKNDQDALMDAVSTVGPIAVSVDASSWSSYRGGIFDGCDYTKNITQNHAVQLVGYGHDAETSQDYWIIRNSWGPRWGEDGYMRLRREREPSCGWAVDTHSGAACDGDPNEEWVCGMCGVLSGATYPLVK